MKPFLIVIQGPTAVGKTALAVELAQKLNCAILSTDSRQFYKEMSIGTAKPTTEEQRGIPHYFIDTHTVEEPLNVVDFRLQAVKLIDHEAKKGNLLWVVTGGSGLFTDALIYGLDNWPTDDRVKMELQEQLQNKGLENLANEIRQLDPSHAEKMDLQNPHRVLRTLEIMRITKKTWSVLQKESLRQDQFEHLSFVLIRDRVELYDRINRRVESMIEQGLEEEAYRLKDYQYLQSLNTVGYKEWWPYFKGEIDLTGVRTQIQQNSRRYAKRQITWLKRNERSIWINLSCDSTPLKTIVSHLPDHLRF